MLPIKKALPLALALSLLPAQGANAWWILDVARLDTQLRLEDEGRTQINANSYFKISVDEISNAPVVGDKYAILQGGVVDKIVTWKETTSTTGVEIVAVPQDSNITVQTTVRDTTTGAETVTSNPVVATPVAPIVTPEPARNEAVDKATITAPTIVAQAEGTNGHRSASVSVPSVPNFDPNKTWATLMIVDKNGSTSAIGLDGVGKVVNVDWLSPTEQYEIKVVLRDLGTGQETTISGSRLP
jgi:putative ribosome biogenesis GTPase RsgA